MNARLLLGLTALAAASLTSAQAALAQAAPAQSAPGRAVFGQTTAQQTTATQTMTPQTATRQASRGPVLLNSADLARIRAQAKAGGYATFLNNCDSRLSAPPRPVARLAPAPHYTATGTNAGDADTQALSDDAQNAYRMGLCYLLTGDAKYAAGTQRILDAWAKTLVSAPNDQGKNGINFNLPSMIIAASWVRGAGGWNSASFDRFLKKVVLPAANSDKPNNHGAWGVLLEASAASYLGDEALLQETRARWRSLVRGAVDRKGVLYREITRSNTSNYNGGPTKGIKGLAYTHYFMMPATVAAKIFADAGKPVWETPEGALFRAAYAQAAAWTLRPQTFPYYASNKGKLEGVRTAAYFNVLQHVYPNKDAAQVIAEGQLGLNGFMLNELFGR